MFFTHIHRNVLALYTQSSVKKITRTSLGWDSNPGGTLNSTHELIIFFYFGLSLTNIDLKTIPIKLELSSAALRLCFFCHFDCSRWNISFGRNQMNTNVFNFF